MIRIRTKLYKISFGVILSVLPVSGFAQLTMGAKALGMGQATTGLPDYEWAVFSNPAVADNERTAIGFYGLRNYGFSELTDMAAFGNLSTDFGMTLLGFYRYGDNLFSETRVRMGYKNSWQNLHFGLVANYNHIAFGGGYGSGGAVGVDLGIAAEITPELWFGARTTNANQPQYKALNEDLPRELAVGFTYNLNELALFSMDVVKDVQHPVSYRGGLDVKIIEDLKGRIGITTEPLTYALGLGYSKAAWEVNITVHRHSLLGFSPGLDLLFFF